MGLSCRAFDGSETIHNLAGKRANETLENTDYPVGISTIVKNLGRNQ
jgi:hypothetical protein